jgi:alkylation response protein AidB-like acyl-CoA dehydrogenase
MSASTGNAPLPPLPEGASLPHLPGGAPLPPLPDGVSLPPLPDGFSLPPASPTGEIASPWITARGREIVERVRELTPLIRAQAAEGERIADLTPDVLNGLYEAGVYNMTKPIEWGGDALGARDVVEIITALGAADGSAGWAGFVGVGLKNLLALDPKLVEEVRQDTVDWVGPAIVGASVFSTKVGSATQTDDGWTVSGQWAFGSGCTHAKWGLVGIQWDPEISGGTGRGVAALKRDQFEIVDDWDVMGLSGTASNSIRSIGEVTVPAHRVIDLAEYPARLARLHEDYTGLGYKQLGTALLIAVSLADVSVALGMARGALEAFAEQAVKRQPFTLPYPTIADMPSAQVAAGKALAMTNSAAAIIHSIADQVDARTAAGLDFTQAEESEIALGLSYAANVCEDAINLLQKTIGSSTVSKSNPIQRYVRDIRVLTSHGAIRLDPQAEVNGRRLLGLPPFPMFGGAVPERRAEKAKVA